MDISWDPKKAAANIKKHNVSFSEATTVLEDMYARREVDHNDHVRSIMTGYSAERRLLIVVHIEYLEDNWIRIISARKAKPRERKKHEKWLEKILAGGGEK